MKMKSAGGYATLRQTKAAASRQRQFALGVGPQRQWKAPAARARRASLRAPQRARAGVGPREH